MRNALSHPDPLATTQARNRSGSLVLSLSSSGDESPVSADEYGTIPGQWPLTDDVLAPGSPTSSSSPTSYAQSGRFFLTDKVVRFLSGGILFQVHSSVLERHSGWYRAYLSQPEDALPQGWQEAQDVPGAPEGVHIFVHSERRDVSCSRPSCKDSVANAIVLEDVSADELEAFFSVLYPRDFDTFGLNVPGWTAVLKAAHLWDCPSIKALAITRLDAILKSTSSNTNFDPTFKRLMLAQTYDVPEWVETALSGLCGRGAALTEGEIAQMRAKDVCRVVQEREARLLDMAAEHFVDASDSVDTGVSEKTTDKANPAGSAPLMVQVDGRPDSGTARSQGEPPVENSLVVEQDVWVSLDLENIDAAVPPLLANLTAKNLDYTASEIVAWANRSVAETDMHSLKRVAELIVKRAARLANTDTDLYSCLCLVISSRISDDIHRQRDGEIIFGDMIFWSFILDAFTDAFDLVRGRCRCHEICAAGELDCRLALTRFLGTLVSNSVAQGYYVRALIEFLFSGMHQPREDDAEALCELLRTAGAALDTAERRETMDGYMDRLRAMEMKLTAGGARRIEPLVEEIIGLRERGWEVDATRAS
ncbi:unnamed protein product [Peniophora sp. CBMAI 1063]|nr:unnamed protein product [Peniophora sp. CBMAI 1063]